MKQFKGGVHPRYYKEHTEGQGIFFDFTPSILILNLTQHTGKPAKPLVKPGDIVRKYQKIAEADGDFSANIHSPITAKVKAIGIFPSPLGNRVNSIVLEPGEIEEAPAEIFLPPLDYEKESKEKIIERIFEAGIVGLGGAAFPTHIKYKTDRPIQDLIINAAECEPFITADDVLMQEKAEEIIEGIRILQKISGAPNVYIGIEDNKPQAIQRLKEILPSTFKLAILHTKYPQGAEKQLIKSILGKEVPRGGLPLHVGVIVNNVGTAYAVYNAVVKGIPLVERVVTVTGDLVKEPKNIMTPIGTKFEELLNYCNTSLDDTQEIKVINGGPMMGIAQYTLEVPVVKGTSAILAISKEIFDMSSEGPCIRCARCINVCPMFLMPNTMYKLIKNNMWEEAREYGTLDCIECGSCSYVCPAKIPLVQMFRYGKQRLRLSNA